MTSFPSSPRDELRRWIESGRVEARCLKRITSNAQWDADTNNHATDWMPLYIKSSYYDMVDGRLCLDPFILSDEDSIYERRENTIDVSSDREFYSFRLADPDRGGEEGLAAPVA